MRTPAPPRLDERRTAEFSAELHERARAWIPSWGLDEGEHDFGRALLEIAARFNAEVAERLDGAGEKMRRGFLDWLAAPREAARPARMPVAFKLADAARDAVLATAPVQLQADAAGTAVTFETEKDVCIVPGRLEVVVGVDANGDAYYLPPPGLSDLQPIEPAPTEWRVKAFTSLGETKLQLDPELGLAVGMVVAAKGKQYTIREIDNGIVAIDWELETDLTPVDRVSKVAAFLPFGGAHNAQEHALYLGDSELLNIDGTATIEVVGAQTLITGVTWQYWGKTEEDDQDAWRPLTPAPEDEQEPDAAVLKKETKGEIAQFEFNGRNSRWIRAYRKTVGTTEEPFTGDEILLRLNGSGCREKPACPTDDKTAPSPVAEGMANTTPLVLQNVFFPLGKEPRQFDSFYLGSKEAFSKPQAEIQLCFEMADPRFAALASLPLPPSNDHVLAGVAADGHLHLLRVDGSSGTISRYSNRDPLRPPSPDETGAVVPGAPAPLDPRPTFRPAMWASPFGAYFFVAVSAGNIVWVWREKESQPSAGGWISLGPVRPSGGPTAPISGLVHLAAGLVGLLYALIEKTLYVRDLDDENGVWNEVAVTDGTNTVNLVNIAPIAVEAQSMAGNIAEGLVGVDDGGVLYAVEFPSALVGNCTKLLDDVEKAVTPAAVRRSGGRLVAATVNDDAADRKFVGFLSDPNALTKDDEDDAELEWPAGASNPEIFGNAVALNLYGGEATFAACLKSGGSFAVAAWSPKFGGADAAAYVTAIPAAMGAASGPPTLMPEHVLAPTAAGKIIVATFDPGLRSNLTTDFETAVVTELLEDPLGSGDFVVIVVDNSGVDELHLAEILDDGVTHGGKVFHVVSTPSVSEDLLVFKGSTTPFAGAVDPLDFTQLGLDPVDVADGTTQAGSILLVTSDSAPKVYEVVDVIAGVATLTEPLVVIDPNLPIGYQHPDPSQAVVRPLMRLDPNGNGDWDVTLLERTRLQFPGAAPEFQVGTAVEVDAGRPKLVALADYWLLAPPNDPIGVSFVVDGSIGEWRRQLGDSSANPELSWEYWNGAGWWTLGSIYDDTLNLKRTGAIRFKVPSDLKETDWSGKTNHWIRARLIGGDYGREKVVVKTNDLGNGDSEQTVTRSSDGIRAPSVLKLHISYALCQSVRPAFVQTQDSGTWRDQSDANRTPGAIVEAFVPLSLTLGRLTKGADSADRPLEGCPADCECETPSVAPQAQPEAAAAVGTAPRDQGRSLYIGLDASPSGAPVNVLLLVDKEQPHDAFAPLDIESLVADRFAPLVADDTTRALGESGLLSLSFERPPTRSELFGKKNLTWLRLLPQKSAAGEWNPMLRGAYLNAAWASAKETLTRELLGSSDGAPNLVVRLARPPLLRHSLELRVKEPLGDEERKELLKIDSRSVLSDVEGLPGDWVLWSQVTDPADEPARSRVYALDESSGEIRFGDGVHGRIPPIGRDSIVAMRYSRTEPDPTGGDNVPGNAIVARTPLNLVSPVESVEASTAADDAAGGAPAESDARVLRFGFARQRHRNCAVTATDLEDLALQSSPDIVQARVFVRPGFVRLVVVMRGADPEPKAAQMRELHRFLVDKAPTSLSAAGALRIEKPQVRRLRVALTLRIETLDHAGALAADVTKRLAGFFDTSTGGLDGGGWPLGAEPSEEDVALAVSDAPFLESIQEVELLEVDDEGKELPSLKSVGPGTIVILDDDFVRIRFKTAEAAA